MRRLITRLVLAALIIGLFSGVSTQDSSAPVVQVDAAAERQKQCVRLAQYKRVLKQKVIRFSRADGYYVHYKIKNRGERRLLRMKACMRKAGLDQRLADAKRVTKHRRAMWRAHRFVNIRTVYGKWAIPGEIVGRESGGSICAMNPRSTAGGYYQFIDSTWYSVLSNLTGKMKRVLRRLGWSGDRTYAYHHPAACLHAGLQHLAGYIAWNGGNNNHWAQTRY